MYYINKAMKFAAQAHDGQYRRDKKTPYIIHPMRVYNHLATHGETNIAVLTAALLHDVVEDTSATLEEIEKVFGTKVATIVDLLTHRDEDTYMEYIHKMIDSPEAIRVKCSDMHDNYNDRGTRSSGRRYAKAVRKLKATNPEAVKAAHIMNFEEIDDV